MAGVVESGTVVALISGVIFLIEATRTIYDAAKDTESQPEAFRRVTARLPLACKILRSAEVSLETRDESARDTLKTTLSSCHAKAEELRETFEKAVRHDNDKWFDRSKKNFSALGKGHQVERLMEGILNDVQVLARDKLPGIATVAQLKELEEAITEMHEMYPSLRAAFEISLLQSGFGMPTT
jgi:hypothetical protein